MVQQIDSAGLSREALQLLNAVAEQLKLPLTTIARRAELAGLTDKLAMGSDFEAIRMHASAALILVDSYLLGLQLMRDQTGLALEPVSISSLLTETAHELTGFAKQYNMELEVRIGGKYAPVMAHQFGLKAALLALGYSLLEGGAVAKQKGRSKLVLAAYRTSSHGITAGLYGDYERLDTAAWETARNLSSKAAQPLSSIRGSAAGLFVADAILQAMSAQLRTSKHFRQQGMATTLQLSQQLQLV